MVARRPRDEAGATMVQTGIAIVLMVVTFLATLNIALAWYSVTALEAEISEAVTHSDMAAVAASGNPAQALADQIAGNSFAIAPENLSVENVVVTQLDPVEETVDARHVEGSSVEKVTRVRDFVRVEADVSYTVPRLLHVAWMDEVVLSTHVDSEATAETRIEVG